MTKKPTKPNPSASNKPTTKAPINQAQRSKQARAIANTLDDVRTAKKRRIEESDPNNEPTDEDDEPSEEDDDEEMTGPLGYGDDEKEEEEESEDELTKAKREVAEMRQFSKDMMAEMANMRSLLASHGTLPSLSTGASRQPKSDLIPLPGGRSQLCVNDLQAYMGIKDKPKRWLEARSHAREIASKANFDWNLPWGQQDKSVTSDAAHALRQVISEFNRFAHNWGADHLIQETFNHRRNRQLSTTKDKDKNGVEAESSTSLTRIDKRTRAWKDAHPELYPKKRETGSKSQSQPQSSALSAPSTPPANADTTEDQDHASNVSQTGLPTQRVSTRGAAAAAAAATATQQGSSKSPNKRKLSGKTRAKQSTIASA